MEPQTIINALGFIVIAGMGWHLATLHRRLHEQARDNAELKVLVAGDYVKRNELQEIVKVLFAKLDRIEEKVDRKVDKGG